MKGFDERFSERALQKHLFSVNVCDSCPLTSTSEFQADWFSFDFWAHALLFLSAIMRRVLQMEKLENNRKKCRTTECSCRVQCVVLTFYSSLQCQNRETLILDTRYVLAKVIWGEGKMGEMPFQNFRL